MARLKIKHQNYPKSMDPLMIPLCDALNSLPGVTTVDSCQGHLRNHMSVFMHIKSMHSIGIIARAVDQRYGCTKINWTLQTSITDTDDPLQFYLSSDRVYDDEILELRDIEVFIASIRLYCTSYFDKYFRGTERVRGMSIPDKDYKEFADAIAEADRKYSDNVGKKLSRRMLMYAM